MKNDITPADEKALALNFAFTALVRALHQSESLDMDLLFANLAGAVKRLRELEEDGAAGLLASLSESLQRI